MEDLIKGRKVKTLVLSYDDNRLGGHAYDHVKEYINSEKYDVKLVTLFSLYGDSSTAIFPSCFSKTILSCWRHVKVFMKFGKFHIPVTDKSFSVYNLDYSPITAKQILKKYGGKPDLIILHWVDGFISSRVLYDLSEMTEAKIAFIFTDDFPLSGVCHYPCGCNAYVNGCAMCPALLPKHNWITEKIGRNRNELLSGSVDYVVGPSYIVPAIDKSPVFSNAKILVGIAAPDLPVMNGLLIRNELGLDKEDFVMIFGCNDIKSRRKGFSLLHDALNKVRLGRQEPGRRMVMLVLGNNMENFSFPPEIKVIEMGYVKFERMLSCIAASDVFISPSIADAGPMMVNYAISQGTPVISFNIGVASDLVETGKTGYIADFADSSSLAEGIEYFINMPQSKYQEIKENCLNVYNEYKLKKPSYEVMMDGIADEVN